MNSYKSISTSMGRWLRISLILLFFLWGRLLLIFSRKESQWSSGMGGMLQHRPIKKEEVANLYFVTKLGFDVKTCNDVDVVDVYIRYLMGDIISSWRTRERTSSFFRYYQQTDRIHEKRIKLKEAIVRYVELERKYGFPVNLNYRNYLKRTTR